MIMLRNTLLGWILWIFIIPLVSAAPATDSTVTPAEEVEKVDINTADVANLVMKLEGIGEKKAIAIVEFREKQGPFKTPADIMLVHGIGEKIFERNKDKIIVSLPSDETEPGSTNETTGNLPSKPEGTTPSAETVEVPSQSEH